MVEDGEVPEESTSGAKEDGEITPSPQPPTKHPLEHSWTLWFDNPNTSGGGRGQSSWGSTLRAVYTFETVEDFWCLYNNIKPPSALPERTDFHLFKKGIEPKWEDGANKVGGKWTVPVPKGSKGVLDTYWLHSLMACIGEHFTEGEEVCGVVTNLRRGQDKLCLWTRTAAMEAAQVSIGKQLKQILDLDSSVRIGYLAHEDAKNSRSARDKYTL